MEHPCNINTVEQRLIFFFFFWVNGLSEGEPTSRRTSPPGSALSLFWEVWTWDWEGSGSSYVPVPVTGMFFSCVLGFLNIPMEWALGKHTMAKPPLAAPVWLREGLWSPLCRSRRDASVTSL